MDNASCVRPTAPGEGDFQLNVSSTTISSAGPSSKRGKEIIYKIVQNVSRIVSFVFSSPSLYYFLLYILLKITTKKKKNSADYGARGVNKGV